MISGRITRHPEVDEPQVPLWAVEGFAWIVGNSEIIHLTRRSEGLFGTGAERIVSQNSWCVEREELVFPGVRVVSPARLMEELR